MKTITYRITLIIIVLSMVLSPAAPVLAKKDDTPTSTPVGTNPPTEEPVTPTPVVETPSPSPSPVGTMADTTTATIPAGSGEASGTPESLPSATATPAATGTQPSESAPAPAYILSLSSNPDFISHGGSVNLDWAISGDLPTDHSLTLNISIPDGFEIQNKKDNENFDEASRVFSIVVTDAAGTIHLKAGDAVTDSVFSAQLLNETEVLAETSLLLPMREEFEVKQHGGTFDAMKGKVKVTFPDGALQEDVIISSGLPGEADLPSDKLSAHTFELKAKGKSSGADIHHFDQALTLEVGYSDMEVTPEQEAELYVYWYNPETGDWNALETTRDTTNKKLYAVTDHFTVFDIGVNDWEAGNLPTTDSFQVSNFTGAATYDLSLDLPAGPGGLKPDITLSYNSQIVDQASKKNQASWVGMGWNMDGGGGSLVPGPNGWYNYLTLNGVTHYIQGAHFMDENFWQVNSIYDSSTQQYTYEVHDTVGNKYVTTKSPSKWNIIQMVNPSGQTINYGYEVVTSPSGHSKATYLKTVTYANGRYRILFEREARYDYIAAWDTDAAVHSYQNQRLARVLVQQDADGDGVFANIRSYEFNYADNADPDIIWPGIGYSAGGKTLTLRSVQEFGADGSSLPATTFQYNDNMHLTSAANGYGGGITYTYESDPRNVTAGAPDPWYYTDPSTSQSADYANSDNPCMTYDKTDGVTTWHLPPFYKISGTVYCFGKSQVRAINGVAGNTSLIDNQTDLAGQIIRPGGMYRVTFVGTRPAGSTVQVGLGPTMLSNDSFTYTGRLPVDAYTAQLWFKSTGNGYFSSGKVEMLPTYYRVTSKTVNDGNAHNYTSGYSYASPLMEVSGEYEFRGNGTVTETHPNGTKTITNYYQDDIRKGHVASIYNQDGSGKNIQVTANNYQSITMTENPTSAKFVHAWVYLADSQQYTYNTAGSGFTGINTAYTYNATYGNVISKSESTWNGTGWNSPYRTTTTDYFPVTAWAQNIISLPARQIVTDVGAGTSTETQYLYDGATLYNTQPTNGVLTATRARVSGSNYAQTTYGHDAYGNVNAVTTYTGYGTASSAPTVGAHTTTTTYESIFDAFPISVSDGVHPATTIAYDYALGVPTSETDANNATTSATYDGFGRITSLTRPGDASASLSMTYQDSYPFTTTISLNSMNYVVTRTYDGMGRPTLVDSGGVKTKTDYISPTETRQYTPYEVTVPGTYTTSLVNPSAHTTRVTAPDGTFTQTTSNDSLSTITDANGTSVWALKATTQDANGHSTDSYTDPWGRVVQVSPPSGPSVVYAYNAFGQLTKATRGGATTSLVYNSAGQKTSMTDADMGYWQYTYDALGNLKTQTDARSCMTTLGYDTLSRLTSKTYSNCPSTPSVTYVYDAGTNGIGHRTSMSSDTISDSWTYDVRGRVTSETAQGYATQYGYNSADLPTSMTYPDGEVVTYEYNARMLLDKLSGTQSGTTTDYVSSILYDTAGRVDSRALGNGLTQDFTYNAWNAQGGRLQNVLTGTLQDLNYTYDNVGNITQVRDDVANSGAGETLGYSYDALDRLTDWSVNATPTEHYDYYDSTTGNLKTKAGVPLAYNDANHKHAATSAGSNTYTYDANGNQITRVIGADTFNLSYDAENRLVEVKKNNVSIGTFVYDGDGKRVSSTADGATTLFIGAHYEVKGSEITKSYFAGATRIATRKYSIPSSMNVEYNLSDHLGSTSLTTDSTGTKVSEIKYKPWGEIRSAWTDSALTTTPTYQLTKYTFTGQYSYMDDPTTGAAEGFGLMYYGARMYDPYLNHFIQADTIVPDGVQGYDRYAYALNNPVKYNDPSGHKPCWARNTYDCTESEIAYGASHYGGASTSCNSLICSTGGSGNVFSSGRSFEGDYSTTTGQSDPASQNESGGCIDSYTAHYACVNHDSNRLPDYFTLNLGGSIPGVGTFISGQLAVTLDRFGNLYVGPGLAVGPEAPLGFSASLSGGYIQSNSFIASGQNGLEPSPGEQRTEEILRRGFVNGSICIAICTGATTSLTSSYTGLEFLGIGVPQASVGGGYSFLIDFTPNSGVPLWSR